MKIKQKTLFMMMAAVLLSLSVTSCHDYDIDDIETEIEEKEKGTEDTAEWPFDECIDSSTNPGDDFYKYISIGYASKYNKGFWGKVGADGNQFVLDVLENPTSDALKALNMWSQLTNDEIRDREMTAFLQYVNTIQPLSNKQLVTLIAHNGVISCPSFIGASFLVAERKGTIISGLSSDGLDFTGDFLSTIANYFNIPVENIVAIYNKLGPLATVLNPILKSTQGIQTEIKKMKQTPGYVPEDMSIETGNSLTTKAGADVSEAFQILMNAYLLGEDEADIIGDLTGSLSSLEKAIDGILQYQDAEAMHEALAAYLDLAYLKTLYTATYTSENHPRVSSANFYLTMFGMQLVSDEYINQKVESSYVQPCQEMATQLRDTFSSRLESFSWMSPTTKEYAKKKLDDMYFWFGLPKSSASSFDVVVDDSIFGTCPTNCLITLGEEYYKDILLPQLKKRSLDDDVMFAISSSNQSYTPYTANAFYNRISNTMSILASNLVVRHENDNVSEAFFYGTLGFTLGHEMCHGFDANGSKYNGNGEREDWWAVSDKLKYKEKQEEIINLFDQYSFVDHTGATCQLDGSQTLTENMADLGGMAVAYDAFCRYRTSQGYDEDGMREQKRRFFLSTAILWSQEQSYFNQYYLSPSDNHSPNCIRAIGANQIDDWYDIFNVEWGDKYYLEPSQRIELW